MFAIRNHGMGSHLARFEGAVRALPAAHGRAHQAAAEHLHYRVVEAADAAGVDTAPVGVFGRGAGAYVGIEHGEAGDRLADVEYGRPETAPNPVLRTAISAHQGEANAVYSSHLHAGIGF